MPVTPCPLPFAPADAHAAPRVCIVAEIGVNHDGSVDRAMQLVEAAARAGADAVKLQLFDPRLLLSNQALLAEYQKQNASDVFAMLDELKLSAEQIQPIRDRAAALGLGFVITPFSLENMPDVAALRVDAVKIASPDAVNLPLVREAAKLGKPLLISTGTQSLDDLASAHAIIRHADAGGCLLQCVSSYPVPDDQAALLGIAALRQAFGLPVGYSDHTTEVMTGALAVAAGACVIEKHLTYDQNAPGPDHAASFEPATFTQYVNLIRQAQAMLGPVRKTVGEVEADVKLVSRQSICIKRDLPAGHVLRREDLTIKRPGRGIPARELDQVVGSVLLEDVRANDLLRETQIQRPARQSRRAAS